MDLAELGCDAGGCGDGCGGGNMDCAACTGEGDDIIECCCTYGWTNVVNSANRRRRFLMRNTYLLRHGGTSNHSRGDGSGSVGGRNGGVEGGAGHPGWNLHPRTNQLPNTDNRITRRSRPKTHWGLDQPPSTTRVQLHLQMPQPPQLNPFKLRSPQTLQSPRRVTPPAGGW